LRLVSVEQGYNPRNFALVAPSGQAGLVSADGAHRYGVVLGPNLSVDECATASLRETMTAPRISLPTFDFGPPLRDLLRTCREQTGLPSPPNCLAMIDAPLA
jgi:N-methylhydantoinase B